MSRRRLAFPYWLITAAGATAWMIVNPPTPDLAAHEYRAEIVRRVGVGVWEQGWYGGHHLPGYSVLVPPLFALASPQLVAAVCAVIASWCFAGLAADHWGDQRAVVASAWFAVGVLSTLVGGQLAFAAGLAPGLAALLAAERGNNGLAGALGAITTLTSPVAAAFLVLAAAAWWLASRPRPALWVAIGAVIPGLAIMLAFPQGGTQPFSFSSFFWSFAVALVIILFIPSDERTLRIGAILYAFALLAATSIDTPLGGNLVRMAAVFGGPLFAGAMWHRRMLALVLIAVPLAYWQWLAPVRSVVRGHGDPSSSAAYHAPLLAELDRLERAGGPFRTEIPFTANHWETRFVAPTHALARGWERQLDIKLNPLFYGPDDLSPGVYRRWLDSMAVRYVALPDVEPDPAGLQEAQLVRSGVVPGLKEIWHSRHWKLYRVARASPLATGPVRVTRMGLDDLELFARRPTTSTVRVRYTPYWKVLGPAGAHGCVGPGPGGWTNVRFDQAGPLQLGVRFALGRVRAHSDRCR